MIRRLQRLAVGASLGLAIATVTPPAQAAKTKPPTAAAALELAPVQKDVPYERVSKEEAANCVVEEINENDGQITGWLVRDASGQLLRRFVDTNQDTKLDIWSYYRDGIEVYRDVDANFNGKADEYRWLGTAGTRWGIDTNEDGRPDAWRRISPEEVTFEVVAALRDRDAQRFGRLLITAAELGELGLSSTQLEDINRKIETVRTSFLELARRQKLVGDKTVWTNFGATQPGVLAAGSEGTTKDLVVYENVAAVVESEGKHAQIPIGTLVQVGATWKLIDLPSIATDDKAVAGPSGYFFNAQFAAAARNQVPEVSPEFQRLADSLQQIENDLGKVDDPQQLAILHGRRADTLEKLFELAPNDEDRDNWLHQFADTISAAVQTGFYEQGVARLEQFADKLMEAKAKTDHVAFVRYRFIMSEYGNEIQNPKANYAKTQARLMERLTTFVNEYTDASDTPDAILQLAIAHEVEENTPQALEWYGKIAKDFPKSDVAKKAIGARRRLENIGQPITLAGKTLDGKSFDLATHRGSMVVVHYWSTSCEPCKDDMVRLKELQAKYAKQKLVIIGINLDNEAKPAADYVRSAKLAWPQLHETGGIDSRLATDFGIFTLPMTLLVDKDGRLTSGSIHVSQLDSELAKQFRERAASTKPSTTPSKLK